MFKIEIKADDGEELQISRGNYVFYKDSAGNEQYWEWSHFDGKDRDFDRIF